MQSSQRTCRNNDRKDGQDEDVEKADDDDKKRDEDAEKAGDDDKKKDEDAGKAEDGDEDEKGKAMIRIVKVGIIISPYPKHTSRFLFFPSQAEVSKSGVRLSVSENLPW